MSEPLVETLVALPAHQFKNVVDAETRRKIPDEVAELLGHLLPAPGERVSVPGSPPTEPRVEALAEALQDKRVVERWYMELGSTKRRIERQIAAKHAELASQDNLPNYDELRRRYMKWRAGVLRFLNAVDDRIDIAREITSRYHVTARYDAILEDRDRLGHRVTQLEGAIRRHKNEMVRHFDEQTDVDLDLWKFLP